MSENRVVEPGCGLYIIGALIYFALIGIIWKLDRIAGALERPPVVQVDSLSRPAPESP